MSNPQQRCWRTGNQWSFGRTVSRIYAARDQLSDRRRSTPATPAAQGYPGYPSVLCPGPRAGYNDRRARETSK